MTAVPPGAPTPAAGGGDADGGQVAVPRMVLMHLLRTSATRRELLVGVKKRGFGQGKVIAPGGRIEPGETALHAAVRETWEETGLEVPASAAAACALLDFRFPYRPEWSTVVAVFQSTRFQGEVRASDELDAYWHDIASLPLASMWDDDAYWLERTLTGERIHGVFFYGPDNATVEQADLNPLPDAVRLALETQ